MQLFYWNRNFEIGIPTIDHQHRILLDLINGLAEAVGGGARLPEVDALAGSLMSYTATHFSEEERYLETASMPVADKAAHRKEHQAFVEKVQGLMRREDLLEPEIIQSVLDFLMTWQVSHILSQDRKIALAMDAARDDGKAAAILDVSPVERILLGALTETERRFRLLSDNTPSLIWVSDALGRRGFFNRAWSEVLGLPMDEVEEGWWAGRIHPEDRPGYLDLLRTLLAEPGSAEAEFRLRDREGKDRWFYEKIMPRREGDGTFAGLIGSAIDVSTLKETESLLSRANEELEREVARRTAQLEQLMLTDPLTGVGNRRHLTACLEAEVARAARYGRELAMMFIDLDHFKKVNDTCGHAVGDQVLVAVAHYLVGCLRSSDTLGRFGGEEFVILLPDTTLESACLVAERWLAGVPLLDIPGTQWRITASFGVTHYRSGDTPDTLLNRCDTALYRAKADGRNRVRAG